MLKQTYFKSFFCVISWPSIVIVVQILNLPRILG